MRRGLALSLALVVGVGACLHSAPSPAQPAAQADVRSLDYRLQARALAPGVYVVEGANADFSVANGCNIINTGPSKRYGEQLRALIQRTTNEPVVQVLNLNLHPDYFFGNQAFADVPRVATPRTRAGMRSEGKSYEDNLYRLCGDWMLGTEVALPTVDAVPGVLRIGPREFELRELNGHTASDLMLVDRTSGVAFAGGLVFARRIPTTPHAQLQPWQASLLQLKGLPLKVLVPSHGPVAVGAADIAAAISGTQRYLAWLDVAFSKAAANGVEMNELLRMPVPDEFRAWAAFSSEFTRNVAHLYPRFEAAALGK
jgi:quinoprotein relay system zinc metallohydrolase 1